VSRTTLDLAVVGAGPYGLSLGAHLGDVGVRVFGRPMSFWRDHMPRGMFLRSPRAASSLSAPARSVRLEDFERSHRLTAQAPVPLSHFVQYGLWFQAQAVSDHDPRAVDTIERLDGRFLLTLDDGEPVTAQRVVVAAGIDAFAWRPELFSRLPRVCVSHTVDHPDLARFKGSRVAVIGGGQSAIESAALLFESGAEVEVIARAPAINWLIRSGALHGWRSLRPLLYGPSDIGPAGLSWVVEWPAVFGRIPRALQDELAARAIRPAAAAWLLSRVSNVTMSPGRSVVSATPSAGRIVLDLDDGTNRVVDHVLLGTGYRVDISRYGFLAPSMLEGIERVGGFPRLNVRFESSVEGLHFVGAPAAWSLGPLFRFVAGARYAARALNRAMGERRPGRRGALISLPTRGERTGYL
jgi:cation diffusion facilitator CzcD-associated flavoprotein CzcO